MKRGLGIDLEREWKKLKRRHFFYLVLPIFLTMLSVRIIQVYFHLKMEQLKRAAASQSPAEGGRQAVPEPARAEAAEMEFFTPEPAPAERLQAAAPEPAADKAAQARNVFDALRAFDSTDVPAIWSQCPDEGGIGLAVSNRLNKAAGFHIITLDET